jgi:aryl-alcohol dehydrogenase-like predicted oxidoreductase
MAFIPWYPLAAGAHTGAAKSNAPQLDDIARRSNVSLAQAAIAWLLARSPVVLPIPGTSSVSHLEENVAAAAVKVMK